MIECKVNPRRSFSYPVLVTHTNGNVWLMSGPTSGTLLLARSTDSREVGYHTNSLVNIECDTKGWGTPLQGSITLSNK